MRSLTLHKIAIAALCLLVVLSVACGGSEVKTSTSAVSDQPTPTKTPASPTATSIPPTSTSIPLPVPACKIIPSLAPGVLTSDLLVIEPVPSGTPANSSDLLGIWEGNWGPQDPSMRATPSVLIVQSVSSTGAKVAYVFRGQLQRVVDWEVTPEGKLRWVADYTGANNVPEHFELTMSLSPDGKVLHGEATITANGDGFTSLIDMERCSPPTTK